MSSRNHVTTVHVTRCASVNSRYECYSVLVYTCCAGARCCCCVRCVRTEVQDVCMMSSSSSHDLWSDYFFWPFFLEHKENVEIRRQREGNSEKKNPDTFSRARLRQGLVSILVRKSNSTNCFRLKTRCTHVVGSAATIRKQ